MRIYCLYKRDFLQGCPWVGVPSVFKNETTLGSRVLCCALKQARQRRRCWTAVFTIVISNVECYQSKTIRFLEWNSGMSQFKHIHQLSIKIFFTKKMLSKANHYWQSSNFSKCSSDFAGQNIFSECSVWFLVETCLPERLDQVVPAPRLFWHLQLMLLLHSFNNPNKHSTVVWI